MEKPTIHLLFKKEELKVEKLNQDKVAVVIDVLLATTTITTCLHHGAKAVIPVVDEQAARKEAQGRPQETYVLVGEEEGRTIDGFLDPTPLRLKDKIVDKTVILSTTNGTVAIRNAAGAREVYISSILNGEAVAQRISQKHQDDAVLIVCSGSSDAFCLEDFYGAGYFLDCLLRAGKVWDVTDAAQAALYFYRGNTDKAVEIIGSSHVGQMLLAAGFEDEIAYAAEKGILPVVPYLQDNKIVF